MNLSKSTIQVFLLCFLFAPIFSCVKQNQTVTTSASQSAKARGQLVRSFAADLVGASLKQENDAPALIREVFANNAEAIVLISDEPDLPKLMKEADLNDFADIRPVLESNVFREFQNNKKLTFLKKTGGQLFLSQSPQERIKLLQNVPDEEYLKIYSNMRSSISEVELQKSPALKLLTDKKSGIDSSSIPKKMQNIYKKVSTEYFDALPFEIKGGVIEEILRLPPKSSSKLQLSAALNRSGPVLQKLFQLIGSKAQSQDVLDVMKELKQNIKPFDTALIEKIFKSETKKKLNDVFSYFEMKPLAAASVGQVHLAKLKNGNDVVVKFLRPGIEERAKLELMLLRKLVGDDSSSLQIIDEIDKALLKELDFNVEAEFLKSGSLYQDAKKGIFVVKRLNLTGNSKSVMIMEKAPGESIAVSSVPDDIKSKALKNLLETWIDRVWFGDGFFHADLHSGNLFIQKTEEDSLGYKLTMLDFGSAGRLNAREQKILTKVAIGLQVKNPDLIIDALQEDSDDIKKVGAGFSKKLVSIFEKKVSMSQKLVQIFTESENYGLKTPSALILFVRGLTFLQDQILDLELTPKNSVLNAVDQIIGKVARKKITQKLVGSMFSSDPETRELATSVANQMFIQTKNKVSNCVEELYYKIRE